ncbi:hypothetical protein I4U23_031267 [Adineta vaga]|nr:hypothetical protein I4U23_031267 [Adineta vaga]
MANCCLKFNYFICGSKNRILNLNFKSQSSYYSLFDQSYLTLNNHFSIKDIILYRHNPNQQLGLTLSYGITTEYQTNIYIEKIENDSIADRQGEFQCGDQIIQINNEKVYNREQAIELIQGISLLIFQIIRFQVKNLSITTPLTENDSGIILAFEKNFFSNQLKRKSNSLSCLTINLQSNKQNFFRHCYSLNDVRKTFKFDSISSFLQSKSLFETTTTTDYEKIILKPLPFPSERENLFRKKENSKLIRRQYREKRLKEEKNSLLTTTDDEILSEFKQGRYWTRQERKEHFQKSKQYRRKKTYSLKNTTDDFNLLNRIFLRENQEELNEKPYLALQFSRQTNIEKEKLKEFIQQYPIKQSKKIFQSTTTESINSSLYHSSSIII